MLWCTSVLIADRPLALIEVRKGGAFLAIRCRGTTPNWRSSTVTCRDGPALSGFRYGTGGRSCSKHLGRCRCPSFSIGRARGRTAVHSVNRYLAERAVTLGFVPDGRHAARAFGADVSRAAHHRLRQCRQATPLVGARGWAMTTGRLPAPEGPMRTAAGTVETLVAYGVSRLRGLRFHSWRCLRCPAGASGYRCAIRRPTRCRRCRGEPGGSYCPG